MVAQDTTGVPMILEAYVHGIFSPFSSPYKNHKPNALYDQAKLDDKQIMMELNNLENENTETLENFKVVNKEKVFYR